MYASRWFMTIYADFFPINVVVRAQTASEGYYQALVATINRYKDAIPTCAPCIMRAFT